MDRLIRIILSERTPIRWSREKSARKRQKLWARKQRANERWKRLHKKKEEARHKKWGIEALIEKNLIYNSSFFDTPSPARYIDWPLIKKEDIVWHYYEYPEDPDTIEATDRHWQHLRLLRNRTV